MGGAEPRHVLLAGLCAAVPPAVLEPRVATLAPQLAGGALGALVLLRCIQSEEQRGENPGPIAAAAQGHVGSLVRGLTAASGDAEVAMRREAAVYAAALRQFPHYALHPVWGAVRAALKALLDDPKRAVRAAAAKSLRALAM